MNGTWFWTVLRVIFVRSVDSHLSLFEHFSGINGALGNESRSFLLQIHTNIKSSQEYHD